MPKHIGLYGGAFDPPHVGHLMVAMWATVTGFVDKVWVFPAHKHPFGEDMIPFEHRFEMCRRAFSIFENVSVKRETR